MQTLLFIHLSLAVPNQYGLSQYFLGKNEDPKFLQFMLQNLASSREIHKIVLLTSSSSCDDPIRLSSERLKNKLPLSFICHDVEEGKEWSFEMKNICRSKEAPQRMKMVFGAYHLEYFMQLKDRYAFDRAVLLLAETSLFLSGEYLDEMIKESSGELRCFTGYGLIPLIIAPYKEVLDKINEEKSEKTQEFLYLKNLLSKKNPSSLKIEYFKRELGHSLCFGDIARKARISLLPVKKGLNPFFSVFTEEDYTLALPFINLMNDLKHIASNSSIQWTEIFSNVILSLKENCLKREKNPFKNIMHFVMDLSALEKITSPETFINTLSHLTPTPRLVTLKIREEDLNSEYFVSILNRVKEMQILSLMISLRKIPLDNEILTGKIKEGLHGLILRVSLEECNEKFFQNLDSLLYYKNKNPQWERFLLYLEIEEADFQEDKKIKEIFDRYLYILDEIIVLPPLKNTGTNLDLSDTEHCKKGCEWSRNTLVLNGRQEIVLCEEVSSIAEDFSGEHWKNIMDFQGQKECCETCSRKGRFNGMEEGEMPLPLFFKNNKGTPDITGAIKSGVLFGFKISVESGQNEQVYDLLNIMKSFKLDIEDIIFHPDFQIILHKMIQRKAYEEALKIIELQLSHSPMNREVLAELTFMEDSIAG